MNKKYIILVVLFLAFVVNAQTSINTTTQKNTLHLNGNIKNAATAIEADCNNLYLIIEKNNAIYDITSLNGTLPASTMNVSSAANQVLAFGRDVNNPSSNVFVHGSGASNSYTYINNINTNVQIPNFLNGITTNPIDGYVYANSAVNGGGDGNRNMLRVYPNPQVLGTITGDSFFNNVSSTNLATDSFFDADGKYYIIAFSNVSGTTEKRLYSVNLSTLQANFVLTITGTPQNSRGLQGLAFHNGQIYMAINQPNNTTDATRYIDIYAVNIQTGQGVKKTTYSGIPSNGTSGSYYNSNIDLASCSTLPLILANPSVSGTVYKDTDGATNINGTGTNAGGLYINAIDVNNKLVYSATVASNGAFTIPTGILKETHNYRFELSKNTGTIGNNAPVKELPSNWTTVGESTSATGNDGTADGMIDLTLSNNNITGLRFGVMELVNNCVTGCNNNTFLNTSDPNTLEYDNFISGFHSSIIKKTDGSFMIWGQNARPDGNGHLYEPTAMTPANGFNYTGTPLKTALGTVGTSADNADQYALLTTDGLYVWGGGVTGNADGVLISALIKSDKVFGRVSNATIGNANSYGLPVGVNPENVKMMFGSYATLAITTCMGEAWVLSFIGDKAGDGTSNDTNDHRRSWHRVHTAAGVPLQGVVAMRGQMGAMIALTVNGELYTWGTGTYLGDGSVAVNRLYATKMAILPNGATPKMIGMTKSGSTVNAFTNSYFVLSTNGEIFSLGRNNIKQLGDFTTDERLSWVNVKSSITTNMTNIVWISPNEHDAGGHAAVTALTSTQKLWGWGRNFSNMLGDGFNNFVDPRYMFGGLNPTDNILAIETGGHINTLFKDCDYKMGYIGHAVNGSYANNLNDKTFTTFQFDGANFGDLCAIPLPPRPTVQDLKVCPGNTTSLLLGYIGSVPSNYTLEWWTTPLRTPGTQVTNPTQVGPGTYYAFLNSTAGGDICTNLVGEVLNVIKYTNGEPEYDDCYCTKPTTTGTPAGYTKVGITVQQKQAAWPENIPNGWIALESKEKGMVITRVQNSNTITEAKEGMLIYDIDAQCVKLYNGTEWKCIEKSCNE